MCTKSYVKCYAGGPHTADPRATPANAAAAGRSAKPRPAAAAHRIVGEPASAVLPGPGIQPADR
mgnify:CR=1 FL=1